MNRLHLSVLTALVGVGLLSIFWHRRAALPPRSAQNERPRSPLVRVFAYLSLLTVGGGMAAFPEMKTLTTETHQWLTFQQLVHLYSVGQLAPGPNMMMIVPIGEWTGGYVGAAAVLPRLLRPDGAFQFHGRPLVEAARGRPPRTPQDPAWPRARLS